MQCVRPTHNMAACDLLFKFLSDREQKYSLHAEETVLRRLPFGKRGLLSAKDALASTVGRLELRDSTGQIKNTDLLAPGDGHACKALWVAGAGGLRRRDRDSARYPKQDW